MKATAIASVAHLSDVHMLDPQPSRTRSGWSMQTRFLSFGRPLDPQGRKTKLERALRAAATAGVKHVVLSGDLTETGAPGEYEALAEKLHDSGIAPEQVTLVPGNHDMYSSSRAWRWALDGPLAAFAPTSAHDPFEVVDSGDLKFLAVDTTFHQPVTRSAGYISEEGVQAIERRAADAALGRGPLVVVQHHPPFVRKTRTWHWIDGLINAPRLMACLDAFRHVFVLHGHMHAVVDRAAGGGPARIFGAPAVVDDRDTPRVRFYGVCDGRLEPVTPPAEAA